jgi:hypothetical protein
MIDTALVPGDGAGTAEPTKESTNQRQRQIVEDRAWA